MWGVDTAGEAQYTPAVANVEYFDVDGIVSVGSVASYVSPLLSEPLQKRNVLTRPR